MDRLSDYDYSLPESLIAQDPLADRSASRLLHLERESGKIHHRNFVDAVDLLRPEDLLIVNDTRVSAIRLIGAKPTGGEVEALLLREESPGLYEALLRPGKRLPVGARISFEGDLNAEVVAAGGEGRKYVRFDAIDNLKERLHEHGLAPLPPYIKHKLADRERYQTVYGQLEGSAAAPTAGLHFTEKILDQIAAKGIKIGRVTLHVGLDTFRPIQSEDPANHPIHGEICSVDETAAALVAACRGRIIAVGTTTVRTLETFATAKRQVSTGEVSSRLFIRPGFEFRIVDGMFTNFHMPRTTMLMMISALATQEMIAEAYRSAVTSNYRFLSFGDSMLIL